MTKENFIEKVNAFCSANNSNFVRSEDAIFPELAGLEIYDLPLVGFSSADDKLYTEEFKKEGVISPNYKAPKEWLPGADSVVSLFFPYTEKIRQSNYPLVDRSYDPDIEMSASAAWLHGRVEGQMFINEVMEYIKTLLESDGGEAVVPQASPEWTMLAPVISNWSERHAAYASGLGTFGLSKGLITKKGMAGRFGSIITNIHFEPTQRPYSSPFEYCIMCGACQNRCPAEAIDKNRGCALGKDQSMCKNYLDNHKLPPHGPNQRLRYGCGKCQVSVPCEYQIPEKK